MKNEQEAVCCRCGCVLEGDEEGNLCYGCKIFLEQLSEEEFANDMDEQYGEGGW